MNNENQDMLQLWLIFAMLLFPTEQNGELKMTQNEKNNLNMLMKEIGDINKLNKNENGNSDGYVYIKKQCGLNNKTPLGD